MPHSRLFNKNCECRNGAYVLKPFAAVSYSNVLTVILVYNGFVHKDLLLITEKLSWDNYY